MRLTLPILISIFSLSLFLEGCALMEPSLPETSSSRIIKKSIKQRVFFYSFDSVWIAAQLALKYPTVVNNQESGVIETDYIKSIEGFQRPDVTKAPPGGERYKITLSFTKGAVNGREAVKLTINKKLEDRTDFFSDPKQLESDGLEESVLFYRIERELMVADGLKKATQIENNNSANSGVR